MSSFASPLRSAGVTLLELVITVAILAIIAVIALPSFNVVIVSNRLSAGANELVGSLQLARSEAIRRGSRVVVCPSSTGADCAGAWSDGWIVFEDRNRDRGVTAGEPILRSRSALANLQILTSPAIGAAVVFRPDGMARLPDGALLAGRLSVCQPATGIRENVRQVEIMSGSRISTSRVDGAGACSPPLNP